MVHTKLPLALYSHSWQLVIYALQREHSLLPFMNKVLALPEHEVHTDSLEHVRQFEIKLEHS